MTADKNAFLSTCYSGKLEQKLDLAKTIYKKMGSALKANTVIEAETRELMLAADKLSDFMREQKMNDRCSQCGQNTGGCCSAYMENNCDAVQLLINMLLDVSPVIKPNKQDLCCFLGANGCSFIVKPLFCLNYNCTHIMDMLGEKGILELTKISGKFLAHQARLEERIIKQITLET